MSSSSTAWHRMDDLLRCGVCSSRFRNPKLLPCSHTFCAEPCLERCADRATKQLRCPECCAEHRVPTPGGVGAFPNNVTLTRFLELRQQVSGREPELPANMQRCSACKERGPVESCAHCGGRRVCVECKAAHVRILRRELALIKSQVREDLKHLCASLRNAESNAEQLQKNYAQVKDEIEEVIRRYTRDLLDTESRLKRHLDAYLKSELRGMKRLEHDLQVELSNVNSNCDLVDKYLSNGIDWTDAELTEYKDIFQRTLDFLRAFDSDPTDNLRKVRFHPRSDPDVIHKTIIDFAEVKLNEEAQHQAPCINGEGLQPPNVIVTTSQSDRNALSRSQSDHRLAGQKKEEERESRRCRDRFKEEREPSPNSLSPWKRDLDNQRNRLYPRETVDDQETGEERSRAEEGPSLHVSETEDATKGPLSGVIRILDSPHVMERLHQGEVRQKRQKEEEERRAKMPPPAPPRQVTRQVSEDEIEKQKKENKAAAAAASITPPSGAATAKGTTKGVARKEKEPSPSRSTYTSRYRRREPSPPSVREERPHVSARVPPREEDRESPRLRSWRSALTSTEREASQSPPGSPSRNRETQKPPVSPRTRDLPPVNRSYLAKSSEHEETPSDPPPRRSALAGRNSPLDRPRLRVTIPAIETASDSSSSSDSEGEEESAARRGDISPSVNTLLVRSAQARKQSASTQARLLGGWQKEDRPWRDTPDGIGSSSYRRRTGATTDLDSGSSYRSSLLDSTRRRSSITAGREVSPDQDRRRNRISRSKSSHDLFPREDSPEEDTVRSRYRSQRTREKSPDDTPHSWSQYLKNKYGRSTGSGLVRSRTSSSLVAPRSGSDNSSDEGSPVARRGGGGSPRGGFSMPRRAYLQKGKSFLRFGARGADPGRFTWPRGVCVGPDNTIVVADSNNHRVQVFHSSGKFLNEFGTYGSAEGEMDCLAAVTVNRIGQFIVSDRYNHRLQVFDPSGRFVRSFGSEGRSDGRFSYPWGVATDNLGFIYVCDKENHRVQVFQGDGTYVTKFGGIGQRPGELEHPHYVCVSSTNRVIVSDSNNHRIQIFDVNGRLLSTFGTEGSDEGQFKYPRGVAVDDQGYLIVGDSGNNRIQIFHPDGTFLKAFGTWGSGDGEFKGLEGVSVNTAGQILVCDRENHRIQVF